jgi:hypothetical protein
MTYWWEIWQDDVWRAIWALNNKIQRFKVCDEIMDPKNYWYTSPRWIHESIYIGATELNPYSVSGQSDDMLKRMHGIICMLYFWWKSRLVGKEAQRICVNLLHALGNGLDPMAPCWERESNRSMIFQPKKQAKDCLAKGKLDTVEEITHSSVRLSLSVKYPSRNMLTTWEQRRGNKWSHRMLHSLKPRKVWT